jgi:7-cyano-7-deazaguanine synthase in queuosine biosynthesis
MISLLMLSGGIDSACALTRLLNETDDELLVHHVHLLTNSRRHIPEAEACRKLVDHCRTQYRDFTYSETTIDHRRMLSHGWDLIASGFEAGVVAASYHLATNRNIDRWFVGLAADDPVPRSRVQQAQSTCEFNCQNGFTPELYLFPLVSPQQQVDYMGAEVFARSWSCRAPRFSDEKNYSPCQRCSACQRRTGLTAPSSAAARITLPSEARSWTHIVANRRRGGGANAST